MDKKTELRKRDTANKLFHFLTGDMIETYACMSILFPLSWDDDTIPMEHKPDVIKRAEEIKQQL